MVHFGRVVTTYEGAGADTVERLSQVTNCRFSVVKPDYCKSYIFWRISNMAPADRVISSGRNGRGNYLMWRYHFFFLILFLFSFPKRQQNEGLTRNSNGRTEGTDPGACIGAWNGRTSGDQGCNQLFFYWPVTTERGQSKGRTLQGIQGEGTITRSKSPRQVFNDKYLELLWISSTGAWQSPSPPNPTDTLFG